MLNYNDLVMHWMDLRCRRWLLVFLILPVWVIAPRVYRLGRESWLARQSLERGLPQQASAHLAGAAREIPWQSGLWEQAGRAALQAGDFQAAARWLEQAEAGLGLSPEGYLSLGDVYQHEGDLESAVQAWEAALEATSDLQPGLLSRLLQAHRELGDTRSAIAGLKALTSFHPADARLRYQLGLLLAACQPEASLAHLAQAAELDAGLKEPVEVLASSIRTARLSGDQAYTLLAAGRALASLQEWELAVEAFEGATLARPDYAEAWAFLGEARQHLQEHEGAARTGQEVSTDGYADLKRSLDLDPHSLSANLFLALYWQRQGSFAQAFDVLQTAASLYPDSPAVQVERGNTLAALGDLSAALDAFQQASSLAPRDPQYLRSLVIFSLGNEYRVREVGLPAARQAVLLNPKDPASLDLMGQVLLQLGDLLTAERFLQRALGVQPDFAPAHLHLGYVYLLNGSQRQAYDRFHQASSSAPNSPTAVQAQRLLQEYFP